MRIETKSLSTKKKLDKSEVVSNKKGNFLEALRQIENPLDIPIDIEDIEQDDLMSLAGLIEQYGETLSNNPSPENFNLYKKHIRLFIKILQANYEVKDTVSRISFSKQKLYKTVEEVDKNLSEIAQMILSKEKSRLSYLKLVNSIKGLLIDLIL